MTVLEVILLTVVATAALVVVAFFVHKLHKEGKMRQERLASVLEGLAANMVKSQESMDRYCEKLGEAEAPLKDVPKLIEGMGRLAAAQVAEVVKFRAEVAKFTKTIMRPEDQAPPGFEAPTEEMQNYAWKAKELKNLNPEMTYETALKQVIEEEIGAASGTAFSLG